MNYEEREERLEIEAKRYFEALKVRLEREMRQYKKYGWDPLLKSYDDAHPDEPKIKRRFRYVCASRKGRGRREVIRFFQVEKWEKMTEEEKAPWTVLHVDEPDDTAAAGKASDRSGKG